LPDLANEAARPLSAYGFVMPEALTPVLIPVERYISADWADREAQRLWPRVWQLACSTDHLVNSGDFYEYVCGRISVIVVRSDDGQLRAFQNVCRHRGNELCSGSGSDLEEIRCSYHRWCWDLKGKLQEIPSRRAFGVLAEDDYSLLSVQVDTWGSLVFINLDLTAQPLHEFLAPVIEETAWLRPDEYATQAVVTIALPCNWKSGIDAFSETYHVQGIHRQMLQSTDDVNGPQKVWGRHGRLNQPYGVASPRLRDGATDKEIWISFCATQGERVGQPAEPGPIPERVDGETIRDLIARLIRIRSESDGLDMSDFSDAQVVDLHQYNCFPNISPVFLIETLAVVRTRPGATPDDCFIDLFFLKRVPPERQRIRPIDVVLDADTADVGAVFNQDIANLQRVQRGLHQPGFTNLTLSPTEEIRICQLHHNLDHYLEVEGETN